MKRRDPRLGVKRVVDIVGATLGLLAASPALAISSLIVRLNLGSPVLFRQQRAGRYGVAFNVLKLRTMAEARDPAGRLLPDNERLGKVGAFLRRWSLDELPQLWNVLHGEMSLVGPRPLMSHYSQLYSPEQARRLEVKPGITGLAQTRGRNGLTWEERFSLDAWYAANWSLRLDFEILARTITTTLRSQGIAAEGQATMAEFRGSVDARRDAAGTGPGAAPQSGSSVGVTQ